LLQRLGELSKVISSGFRGYEEAKARLRLAGQELVQIATLHVGWRSPASSNADANAVAFGCQSLHAN